MSNRAKSTDENELKRYFVEERWWTGPSSHGDLSRRLIGHQRGARIHRASVLAGLLSFPSQGYFWAAFIIGGFSTGTGLFGTLIFLDKRENTFTVPVNRVASILAGLVSTYCLAIFFGKRYPSAYELIGAALIILAIVFLMYRTTMEKRPLPGCEKAEEVAVPAGLKLQSAEAE